MNQQVLQIYIPLLAPFATLAIVLVGFIYNNSRLNDVRDLLRAEAKTDSAEWKAEISIFKIEANARFDRLEAKMDQQHDTIMRMLADIEGRVTRLEERR